MTTLTKEQVRELPPEQQEALAGMEVQRLRSRRERFERASRGMSVTAGLLTGLVSGVAMLCIPFPRAVPLAVIAVIGLVTFHATRLYRRLDAMAELLKNKRDDDHAA